MKRYRLVLISYEGASFDEHLSLGLGFNSRVFNEYDTYNEDAINDDLHEAVKESDNIFRYIVADALESKIITDREV